MEPSLPSIPSLAQCLALMEQHGMLANIRHHSLVVARLAAQIQAGLCTFAPHRPQADCNLVITAALLHDIAKTPCLGGKCDHAQVGAEICRQQGYPEIATIVEHHVLLAQYDPCRYQAGSFTAREIVYYADKRVRHNTVVHLNERLAYILDHYGKNNPARQNLIRENFNKCRTLEQHLFNWLSLDPAELGWFP